MELNIGIFPVEKIVFDRETRLDGEVLKVSRGELRQLVLTDPRIKDVEIEIVTPGGSARIIHVCDAIEPQLKVTGPGVCYPGILGAVDAVGNGTNHRLQGAAVILSTEYPRIIETGTGAALEAILDMSGPGALSPLSRTNNLVLTLHLASGYLQADSHQAVRVAGFKVAHRLASTTEGKSPHHWRQYQLSNGGSGLPRIVYIHQILTQLNLPVPYATWYGAYITDWMPFWVHPNEILDGALLPSAYGGYAVKPTSWQHVNNAVIEHLYEADGKSLEFIGVILQRTRFETFQEKQISANQAAKLAKLMGAQGVILTWIGSGNAFIEEMLTAQALEREGIKAVMMTHEYGGKEGLDPPLIFTVPEADAIVSIGSLDRSIMLPPVTRVIGGVDLNVNPEASGERIPAHGEIQLDRHLAIACGIDHWGSAHQTCLAY